MRRSFPLVLAALLAAPAASAAPAPISGNWKTDDGNAIVSIGPCTRGSAELCGTISRFLIPEPAGGIRDKKNPDAKLRGRRVLGTQVLWGLKPDGTGWKGNGYSARDGRNFNATVTADGGRLSMKGCVSFFCRTVVWTRA